MFIKEFIFGMIIGIANVIPGVSGGTFALILGIYDKLIEALNKYDKEFLLIVIKNIFNFELIYKELKKRDFIFLMNIFLGAVISIILTSKLISYSIEHYYEYVYSLFFGLILGSIPVVLKRIRKFSYSEALFLFLGVFITFYITYRFDPAVKVIKKSEYYMNLYYAKDLVNMVEYEIQDLISIFFVSMLAISAMILPGISGSFIFLISGKYFVVINAISRISKFYLNDILIIFSVMLGIIVGMLVFVRLLKFLLNNYYDKTLSFLLGLVIGGLYAIYPFKYYKLIDLYQKIGDKIVHIPNYKVYTNSIYIPSLSSNLFIISLIFFLLGIAIMAIFMRYDKE